MSGGSQHNPNGRQSQIGAGWSPLQLQMANLLARAPQAHMASDRGVTWHTPTPPPHLYHVPAPSPPALDPLQAMKGGANSVFRHTATPPELYRHTPTPPDKHLMSSRHTPSPGDVKGGAALTPTELYPHLGPGRDKLMRPEDLMGYARGGVDLTVGGPRGTNGSPAPMHPTPGAPALSVRDAPTINSLIARAAPHARPAHARVDALLERLSAAPAPSSPHSVIVHSRAAPTPSPPSSNEDSADSCGAPPGSKRKRKPERTIRVPVPPPLNPPVEAFKPVTRVSPHSTQPPLENGDTMYATQNGPEQPLSPPQSEPHVRRKTRSGSAETIDDIAAMIASTTTEHIDSTIDTIPAPEPELPVTVDKLKSVLASPEPEPKSPVPLKPLSPPPQPEEQNSLIQNSPKKSPPLNPPPQKSPPKNDEPEPPATAAAPRRRSARNSNAESTNVPVASPSEAKPAEPEASEVSEARTAEPTAASFVEVENQLEKMFAGLEEENPGGPDQEEKATTEKKQTAKARKRRKSAPTKGERKASKRANRSSTGDEGPRRKAARKKVVEKKKKDTVTPQAPVKDAYDSGSNASSSRSRGPYIQIVGPRDSPVSVSVVNATAGATDEERRTGDEWRNGLRARGLHASTLGLRYDASTPDASWLCAFCEKGPHYAGLGDLFGPYQLDTSCEEFRALDEASKQRFASSSGGAEVWFHEACGVWAPGLLAAGSRVWGLVSAVCGARSAHCGACGLPGAALSCATRSCRATTHVPCATTWTMKDDFRALCPRHA
ncbi:mediator of DNA damage checkpoint protein 1-like isoform X3 [Pararge aegeria]|uniref:mediator of DNA damage checkpoint protein 1-like isoform X3 n=1 Tax=Pararge aegeria TaxID=116150 RepID=UPI0019D17339|nr:mediator of DNA damage checkpoint protein 1-like isoform X3 [Pararge aegeria]